MTRYFVGETRPISIVMGTSDEGDITVRAEVQMVTPAPTFHIVTMDPLNGEMFTADARRRILDDARHMKHIWADDDEGDT